MKHFISFLIFLLFAILGMWWYYSCDWCLGDREGNSFVTKEKLDPEAEALAKKAFEDSVALANGLYAKDKLDADVFRYPENLQINNANGDVLIPTGLSGFENKIATYLGKNQDQEIKIYGYETQSERDSGDNLGLSRANFIKNLLVKAGVNGDKIIPEAKLVDYSYDQNGIYKGGVLLNFDTIDDSRMAEVEKGIANKTLYSNFGSKEFKPDATLSNYTLELKNYLNKYPDKKVNITGHTDNIGKASSNLSFGLKRATNVKNYFVSKGIPTTIIKVESKGESAPVASNDTKEGRAKNRRIEIIVN